MSALNVKLILKGVRAFPQNDLMGDEFAHLISRITLSWGRIEGLLYLLLEAIDRKRADHWLALLFAKRLSLGVRKKLVKEAIRKAVEVSYPEYIDRLDGEFDRLQKIQDRRNLIAHGLWLSGTSDREFVIQPLHLKDGVSLLEGAVKVDLEWFVSLIRDIEFLDQGLSSLIAEMLAHQQLKKWGCR